MQIILEVVLILIEKPMFWIPIIKPIHIAKATD